MSRVLLFCQSGSERPKCVGPVKPSGAATYTNRRPMAGMPEWALTFFQRTEVLGYYSIPAADHWWLCECENADAGRRVILCADSALHYDPLLHERFVAKCGRILAQGGKP